MAPIRHLVGGKDNRRVESSHLDDDDDDVVGERERLLLIKVGLSKNGKEGGRHVNSKQQQVVHSTTLPPSLLRFSSFFCCRECSRLRGASPSCLHLHKQIQLGWGHFLSRLVRGRHWRTRHQAHTMEDGRKNERGARDRR